MNILLILGSVLIGYGMNWYVGLGVLICVWVIMAALETSYVKNIEALAKVNNNLASEKPKQFQTRYWYER